LAAGGTTGDCQIGASRRISSRMSNGRSLKPQNILASQRFTISSVHQSAIGVPE
jgi:hypothetical protein